MSIMAEEKSSPPVVESCGVCGALLPLRRPRCEDCGAGLAATPLPVLGGRTLADTLTPADVGRTVICHTTDALTIILCAGAGSLALGAAARTVTGTWPAAWLAIGAVIGLAAGSAAWVKMISQYGRGPGGLAAGLRRVDTVFFVPSLPRPRLPRTSAPWSTRLADVRRGPDPLSSALPPVSLWAAAGDDHPGADPVSMTNEVEQ